MLFFLLWKTEVTSAVIQLEGLKLGRPATKIFFKQSFPVLEKQAAKPGPCGVYRKRLLICEVIYFYSGYLKQLVNK